MAYDHGEVDLQAPVRVRIEPGSKPVKTTVGRALLYEICPPEVSFELVNQVMDKKQLADLIDDVYRASGKKATVLLADALRTLGYTYATKAGISICIDDMMIPDAQARAPRRGQEGSGARSRSSTPKVSSPTASATTRSSTSGPTSPSAIAEEMMNEHRPRRSSTDPETGKETMRAPSLQPDLHHGRLGRPRLGAADAPAGRHARPDGQAVRRDHRDADHRELPRGSLACCSTSSRPTAPARAWPTPRSRPRTPVT